MSKKINLYILLNPIAGHGQSIKTWSKFEHLLEKEGVNYSTEVSPYPGAFISIAKEYADHAHDKDDFLVVIGGDGSLNDVLNGIKLSNYPETPIVYIPAGSGNDFARGAKISDNLHQILDALLDDPEVVSMDCGSYTGYDRNSLLSKRSYFVNNFGIGFDAFVVHASNRQRLKNALNKINVGSLIYRLNVLGALHKQDTFKVTIKADGKRYDYDNAYMVTTTNHPYFGGGVPILPSANIHDNKLSTVVVQKPNLSKFIHLFTKILSDGSQIEDPHFHFVKADEITVQTSKPEYCQVDGEDSAEKLIFKVEFKIDHFNLIKY